MADSIKIYSADSRKRIDRAVRRIERSPPGRGGGGLNPALFRDQPLLLGKTAAAINKGFTGTVNIYTGNATKGSETWDGTTTVQAYNRFANVASGKWVFLVWILGGWELIVAEC